MKAIILAAGFATRLYPLTKNRAKPLLEIKGKLLIDYIIEKIGELPINEIIVITNNKFYNNFLQWKKNKNDEKIKVLNNRIDTEEEKLGAIGDLLFVINKKNLNEDLFVISGDNLFEFSLKEPYEIFKKENKDLSIFYDIKDLEEAKRFGIALVENNLLIDFEEKPSKPKSTLCSTSTYFYKKETLGLIKKFNEEEKNKDYPGLLLEYLFKKVPIYAHITKEKWFDVGTIKSLEEARKLF